MLSAQFALVTAAVSTGAAIYTFLVIMPVNRRLEATAPYEANGETRRLIEQWGTLHAGRNALGLAATLAYLWAMN